nr:plasmid stabilization protein [Frankia sp. Cppng1_Ct_nod]
MTIRELDDTIKARLRIRAAQNGRSMEAEVRAILRAALTGPAAERGLGSRIQRRFTDLDGFTLSPPPRTDQPQPAEFPS